jgi:hypothetical protein
MIVCNHGIAGPCPICRSDRRADIAERELRETAEELERVRVRLEEATGLLDTASDAIDEACYPVWWERYRAFLSGAPAREAGAVSPGVNGMPYANPKHSGYSCEDTELGHATWMQRATAAEAQLAAVRDIAAEYVCTAEVQDAKLQGERALRYFHRLIEALKPANGWSRPRTLPTPGAGEKP